MSESIHFRIAEMAADLVEARSTLAALKRERSSCVCENYSKPDYGAGDRGDPECWTDSLSDPNCDPEALEWCDPCKKRMQIHPRVLEASKAATKAWYALKRGVNKAKKTQP
jgi:hypothetical protein